MVGGWGVGGLFLASRTIAVGSAARSTNLPITHNELPLCHKFKHAVVQTITLRGLLNERQLI